MNDLEQVAENNCEKMREDSSKAVSARTVYEFCTCQSVYYKPDIISRIKLAMRLGLIRADVELSTIQKDIYEKGAEFWKPIATDKIEDTPPRLLRSIGLGAWFKVIESWFSEDPLLGREETAKRLSGSKAKDLAMLIYDNGGNIDQARASLYTLYERHVRAQPRRVT